MLADVEVATRHLDLRRIPVEWLGGLDVDLTLFAASLGRGGPEIPLLDRLTDIPPSSQAQRAGPYVRFPTPGYGNVFCLRTSQEWRPVFRDGEYLLIECREHGHWRPEEANGRVCVIQFPGAKQRELAELLVVRDVKPVEVQVVLVRAPSADWKKVKWEDLRIWGVMLMTFRTQVHLQNRSPEQTLLFSHHEISEGQS
ncbi:MAG: hypothetical protein KAX44_01245 [Candidatus Brocadiae bacterium]|nr:hypothetical protein [Candidatus Brocadiia bacterium]